MVIKSFTQTIVIIYEVRIQNYKTPQIIIHYKKNFKIICQKCFIKIQIVSVLKIQTFSYL